jgi:hypothetical protein
MITKEMNLITGNPKIFTDEKFKALEIGEKIKMYKSLCKDLNMLIARIMDLYGLEKIIKMPPNSTTVIIAGADHTDFIFSRLCIIDNYNLLETEKTFESKGGKCCISFPFTNPVEINEFNNIIQITRAKLYAASDDEKNNFYNNLLKQGQINISTRTTDTLIDYYGLFYTYLRIDIDIVFKDIKRFQFYKIR